MEGNMVETRIHFHEKLEELKIEVLKMGGLVEEAIGKAIYSLVNNDKAMAMQVIAEDDRINKCELKIEDRCVILLATEQPVARDLRLIVSVLKAIRDLERMGDYAAHLARTALNSDDEPVDFDTDLSRITAVCVEMLKEALTAFAEGNVDLAEKVRKRDEIVDNLYLQLFRNLLVDMREHAGHVNEAGSLLLVAKYLERLADHITNMCEEIVFMCTGKRKEWSKSIER